MSYADFEKIVDRAIAQAQAYQNAEEEVGYYQAREMVYEEFTRYIARGGVNAFHAMKIARLISKAFDLPKGK